MQFRFVTGLVTKMNVPGVVSLLLKIGLLCLLTGELIDISDSDPGRLSCGTRPKASIRLASEKTGAGQHSQLGRSTSGTKALVFAEALDWKTCASSSPQTVRREEKEEDIEFSTSAGRLRYQRSNRVSRNVATRESSSDDRTIKDISIVISPDPPRANSDVELKLSLETTKELIHPIAYISGMYKTMWGLLEVPFEHALDYCTSEHITTSTLRESEGRCPVDVGRWDIMINYKIPDIPFSGEMDMKVELADVGNISNLQSIQTKPDSAIDLICVNVKSRLDGSFMDNF